MIQKILSDKHYLFTGTIDELRHCMNSLKIKIIQMGELSEGISTCEATGKFKYKGQVHKIYISKVWTEDKLIIKYRGVEENEKK